MCWLNENPNLQKKIFFFEDGDFFQSSGVMVLNLGLTTFFSQRFSPLVKSVYQFFLFFSYFSTKTYVAGTQKNRLKETVLLRIQNMLKMMG